MPKDKAIIFDIQRFSIHDGPGIRSTIFFKGCNLKCAWCQNPESLNPAPETAFYEDRCILCGNCLEACPEKAILKGLAPRINRRLCKGHGKCVEICQPGALKIIGSSWGSKELFAEIMKDLDFFRESGGGITLSGGEPLLQCDFLRDFLPMVREAGIHINLETSGMAPWKSLEKLLPFLDMIFFDIKMIDNKLHKEITGVPNGKILGNFARLCIELPGLTPRMPVIPGLNDTKKNIIDTALFLKKHKKTSIHLLPYHNMGEAKLPRIDTSLTPLKLSPRPGFVDEAAALFMKKGISPEVYS